MHGYQILQGMTLEEIDFVNLLLKILSISVFFYRVLNMPSQNECFYHNDVLGFMH